MRCRTSHRVAVCALRRGLIAGSVCPHPALNRLRGHDRQVCCGTSQPTRLVEPGFCCRSHLTKHHILLTLDNLLNSRGSSYDYTITAMSCMEKENNVREMFLYYLRHEKGLADKSIAAADHDLSRLLAWLGADSDSDTLLEVTRQRMLDYLSILTANLAPASVDRKLWSIKTYYSWANRQGLCANPVQHTCRTKRRPRNPPKFVPTVKDIENLLAQPNIRNAVGIRDRAILELLYGAGLRAGELLGIELNHLDIKNRCLRVNGKGNKERVTVFGQEAQHWLAHYLKVARPKFTEGRWSRVGGKLFLASTPSGELTYQALLTLVRKHASKAGLTQTTPHTLRHAFATHLYQNGANLRVIQMLLGHSDLETTTIYTQCTTPRMRELLNQHHPRSRNPRYCSSDREDDQHRNNDHEQALCALDECRVLDDTTAIPTPK